MKKNENENLFQANKINNLCDESFYEIGDVLQNPNKIGNILIKYISHDLRRCTWENEGKQVNFLLLSYSYCYFVVNKHKITNKFY